MNELPAVAAAVIVRGGRVLLARRRVPEGSLAWHLPGGKLEPGESPTQAAVREAREETGLDVAAVRTLGKRVHPATGRRMIYVVCEVIAGEAFVADARELAEVQWCDRARVSDLVPHGFFLPVQQYLDEHLT